MKWSDVNFDKGTITIMRQLLSSKLTEAGQPDFGATKTGKSRTVDLNSETVALLRAYKSAQAEVKLKNRTTYVDFGLAFAREHADLFGPHAKLGHPVRVKSISRELAKLVKAADVKRVKFHGLRHTSATLLLQAGVAVKVVSERLGHAKASMTLDIYQHVMPTMGRGAADLLGTLLHGEAATSAATSSQKNGVR